MQLVGGQGLVFDRDAQAQTAALIVEVEHLLQSLVLAVVHVGCGQGHVAQGGGFEGVAQRLQLGEGVAAQIRVKVAGTGPGGHAQYFGLRILKGGRHGAVGQGQKVAGGAARLARVQVEAPDGRRAEDRAGLGAHVAVEGRVQAHQTALISGQRVLNSHRAHQGTECGAGLRKGLPELRRVARLPGQPSHGLVQRAVHLVAAADNVTGLVFEARRPQIVELPRLQTSIENGGRVAPQRAAIERGAERLPVGEGAGRLVARRAGAPAGSAQHGVVEQPLAQRHFGRVAKPLPVAGVKVGVEAVGVEERRNFGAQGAQLAGKGRHAQRPLIRQQPAAERVGLVADESQPVERIKVRRLTQRGAGSGQLPAQQRPASGARGALGTVQPQWVFDGGQGGFGFGQRGGGAERSVEAGDAQRHHAEHLLAQRVKDVGIGEFLLGPEQLQSFHLPAQAPGLSVQLLAGGAILSGRGRVGIEQRLDNLQTGRLKELGFLDLNFGHRRPVHQPAGGGQKVFGERLDLLVRQPAAPECPAQRVGGQRPCGRTLRERQQLRINQGQQPGQVGAHGDLHPRRARAGLLGGGARDGSRLGGNGPRLAAAEQRQHQ